MQHAQLASASAEFFAQPTADFCDAYPDAQVLQGRYESFGALARCAGRVETVSTRDDNWQVKAVLGEPGDGRVLFVDNSASLNCAMLGGNLAQMAAGSGWAGIIINGAVRDVEELRETQIAVFALGTCPRKSIKRGFGSRGTPVRIAGTLIQPNDIIAADADGVVVLASWGANRPHV